MNGSGVNCIYATVPVASAYNPTLSLFKEAIAGLRQLDFMFMTRGRQVSGFDDFCVIISWLLQAPGKPFWLETAVFIAYMYYLVSMWVMADASKV